MTASAKGMRYPAIYLPHGAGPWPFMEIPAAFGPRVEWDALAGYLRDIGRMVTPRPTAALVVTAHWVAERPTVSAAAQPTMLYDYSGFPPETYRLNYPAPGSPALAARVRTLLNGAGRDCDEDARRGYDHGTFVPLMLIYPEANIPVVQLSLQRGLDPRAHFDIGRALQSLRDEGVVIIGSGMSYHNMRAFFAPGREYIEAGERFDDWLTATVERADPEERARELAQWEQAPGGLASHQPTYEHLTPLFVMAGAAGADRGRRVYSGRLIGMPVSGYQFG
ncbi:MAG: dioxygenase [Gammaproteobacteria bacterium]|nr:dioxygenase [Gammaproteobacteria bacterium]